MTFLAGDRAYHLRGNRIVGIVDDTGAGSQHATCTWKEHNAFIGQILPLQDLIAVPRDATLADAIVIAYRSRRRG